MPFNVSKSEANPAGEPLYAAARRLRTELERQMVAAGPEAGHDPASLQAVGLLLQLEGLDRQARHAAPLAIVDGDGDGRGAHRPLAVAGYADAKARP